MDHPDPNPAPDAAAQDANAPVKSNVSAALRALAAPGPFAAAGHAGVFHNLVELFAQVVHEGKNHLSSIRGYASLIQDDNECGSNARRWADKIVRDAERMERYLERLAMLRVEGAAHPSVTSWADVFAGVMDWCRPLVRGVPHVEVRNEAAGEFIQHRGLLKRSLFQIVRNAIEAAGARGTVALGVREGRVAAPGGSLREFTVTVRDDGPGIAPAHADLVWAPFFSTRQEHMGLGLPYVAVVAPAIGMDVDIESQAGKGTTVSLVLREQGGQT
jgi:signal transduction histidine kinase